MAQRHPGRPQPAAGKFDPDQIRLLLEHLIDTCRDGEQGYLDAADRVEDPELRGFFAEQARERGRFAVELRGELERLLGKWESTREGSVGGMLRRAWIDVKSALGGGDLAILESVEAGEDAARDAYQKALSQLLPPDLLGRLRTQAQSVYAAHDHVRMLRNRRRAA
ncbi:MAG TPA: PA2169 family four-helix-bundle protein [Terriglobales bacterium]|jgi:uncharacterized protein (TIGR02284 family)|nr:PA2169 family four-helix-bundle protein [Terriglobales bacterium]